MTKTGTFWLTVRTNNDLKATIRTMIDHYGYRLLKLDDTKGLIVANWI
jgi:hypothetical protein